MNEVVAVLSATACCPDQDLIDRWDIDGSDVDRSLLPAAIRRRTSLATRIAVTAAATACRSAEIGPAGLPSVFASVGGEVQIIDHLCRALSDPSARISPTQFHNSVHNTTSAYWSIVSGCHESTTAIAAAYDTFAIGLLETWSQARFRDGPILFVCYDEEWPQYLSPPLGRIPFACAFVLTRCLDMSNTLATISAPMTGSECCVMDQALVSLAECAPAAAGIPLLTAVHSGQPGTDIPLSVGDVGWITRMDRRRNVGRNEKR